MPGPHAIALIVVTLATFYLYTRPWIRIELVSLLLLLALVVLFYVVPFGEERARFTDVEIFEAFGHPALIAICSLMILGRGLTVTGAMEPAVRLLGACGRSTVGSAYSSLCAWREPPAHSSTIRPCWC